MAVLSKIITNNFVFIVSNIERTKLQIGYSYNMKQSLIQGYVAFLREEAACFQLVHYEDVGVVKKHAAERAKELEQLSFKELCKFIKQHNPNLKTLSDDILD